MHYTSRQIRDILGLSTSIISRLIEEGFVKPSRGPRRELRFSFQDLVVLRAAKGLADARLPARRISVSLKKLRQQLPAELPATGLRIAAVGDSVAVMDAAGAWRAADGQYLLSFEVTAPRGQVRILEKKPAARRKSAEQWFDEGCTLEDRSPEQAIAHYRKALDEDICHAGVYTNLGRLLQEKGDWREAQAVYLQGTQSCPDDALLYFNLGVLLEEQSKSEEAIVCYETALEKEPKLIDAHYNLGLLYEAAGKPREALRHFSACRKLKQ
jgi:tetratricopeptide (TPR) repeat protein